ncbi:MAG: lysophospholipase, partial [Undibacterium sp.]|nr:lysophospholipase [Undibacterium sp.]
MKNILHKLALCSLFALSLPACAEDAQGDWIGKIAGQLRLHVHVEKTPQGTWTVNVRSPDQGNMKMDANQVNITEQSLSFAISSKSASFDSKWDDTSKTWIGQWHQGQDLPLNLSRMDAQTANAANMPSKRPQEEKISKDTPPYRSEDVSFSSKDKQFQLAGTYSAPLGRGPFPAVILVHGSGRNTRDEEILGHKIFLVLADHLNRQGVAVLRYDKRGTGASKGDYAKATSVDFADDAQVALAYLRGRAEVNQEKIGVIGHSEGGMIAPMLANREQHLAFVVMLAGPGIRGDKLLPEQKKLVMTLGGASDKDIQDTYKSDQKIYAALANSKSNV